MALTGTTAASAIAQNDLTVNLTSNTGNAVGNFVRVDNEFMVQTGAAVGNVIPVRRGLDGSAVLAHNLLANVTMGLPTDYATAYAQLTAVNPEVDPDMVTIGANIAAIPAPVRDTIYVITKGSALASTNLAAPSIGDNGVRVTITSQTAFAHVVTATSLIADAVTGSPHSTATFAAFKGATLILTADAGLWNVTSAVGVTIT